MKFCDDCKHLDPKEQDQFHKGAPHRCKKNDEILLHYGYHPRIPVPDWCLTGPEKESNYVFRLEDIKRFTLADLVGKTLYVAKFTEGSSGIIVAKDMKTEEIFVVDEFTGKDEDHRTKYLEAATMAVNAWPEWKKEAAGIEKKKDELLPCPFCGSTDVCFDSVGDFLHMVECKSCEALVTGKRKPQVRRKWNTRK